MADVKALKLKRRGSKARVTRFGNELQLLIDEGRGRQEVHNSFAKIEKAFDDLQEAHENYTITIEDDDTFEKEEEWMEECQQSFAKLKMKYLDHSSSTETDRDSAANLKDVSSPADKDTACNTSTASVPEPSCFKMEKPRLPKFTGDIR